MSSLTTLGKNLVGTTILVLVASSFLYLNARPSSQSSAPAQHAERAR